MDLTALVFLISAIFLTSTTLFAAAMGEMAIAMTCAALSVVCPVMAMVSYSTTAPHQSMLLFDAATALSVLFFGTGMAGYLLQQSGTVAVPAEDNAPVAQTDTPAPKLVNVTALAPVSHRRSRRHNRRRLHLPVMHFPGHRSGHAPA